MVHKLVNIEPTDYYTGHSFILLFFFLLCFFFFFCGSSLMIYISLFHLRICIVKISWNRYWQCSHTGLWILSKAVDLAGLVKAADHYYILNICQK